MHWETNKFVWLDLLVTFDLLWWSGTKATTSLRYACILVQFLGLIFPFIFLASFLLVLRSLSVVNKAQERGAWISGELLGLLLIAHAWVKKPESCHQIPQLLPRSCPKWTDCSDPSWHQHQLPSLEQQQQPGIPALPSQPWTALLAVPYVGICETCATSPARSVIIPNGFRRPWPLSRVGFSGSLAHSLLS